MTLKGKNVLVTGAGGFVGQNAVLRLLEREAYPVCLMRAPSFRTSVDALEEAFTGGTIFYGDICDQKLVSGILARYEIDYIIHLAAISIVGQCDNNPSLAYRVNIGGIVSLMEAIRGLKREKPFVVCMTCYDDKTRALTIDGLKTYDEITPGDKVLSINPKTREIEETSVLKVNSYDHRGKMIEFKGKSTDLLVTPNHRMFLEVKDNELGFIRADSEIPSRGYKRAYGSWVGKNNPLPPQPKHHWNIKKINPEPRVEDILYLMGIFVGDGCINHQKKQRKSKSGMTAGERVKQARDNKGQFCSITKNGSQKFAKSMSNVVYLYIPYEDSCRSRLEACLDHLGIRFSNWDHGGEGAITFSSAEICYWLKDVGQGALNKRIPKWAMQYPPDKLSHLLDGIIDSDGHIQKSTGQKSVTTISFGLVQDLIELGIKCGYDVWFGEKKKPKVTPSINGRAIRRVNTPYVVSFSKQNKSIIPSHQKVVEDYEGKVWCLTLETNKNFIVERNGFITFCGNSDKAYGSSSPPGGYKESTPLAVGDAYSTSKACKDMIVRSYARTFDIPACVVRAGNLYGPRDLNLSRLIPKAIVKLLNGDRPILYSHAAEMIREFIYVEDILDVYETLFEKGVPGEAYNVGGTPPRKIKEVIDLISTEITGDTSAYDIEAIDFSEIQEQFLSAEKLQSLGWTAKTSLEDGIKQTIDWYRDNLDQIKL